MNIWDILILLAVAGIAVFGFLRARKQKASGKGCCGDCCQCGLACPAGSQNTPRDKETNEA